MHLLHCSYNGKVLNYTANDQSPFTIVYITLAMVVVVYQWQDRIRLFVVKNNLLFLVFSYDAIYWV